MRRRRSLFECFLVAGLLLVSAAVTSSGADDEAAVTWLIVTLFASSLALVFFRVRASAAGADLGRLAVVVGFLFWYSLPALRTLLYGSEFDEELSLVIDHRTVIQTVFYLSLFLFASVVLPAVAIDLRTAIFDPKTAPPTEHASQARVSGNRVLCLALIACLVGLSPYFLFMDRLTNIVDTILASRRVEKAWQSSTNLGDASSAFGSIASSLLVAGASLLWIRTWKTRGGILPRLFPGGVALLATAVVYFDHGTRSTVALVLVPVLILMLLAAWKRSPVRALGAALATGGLLFALLQFQVLYRTDTITSSISDQFFEDWVTLGGSSDFFKETLFAVRLIPAEHDFFHESVLLEFLTAPIPRFLWPDKPIPELVWFFSFSRWNVDIYDTGGNVLPGVVGQFYMNWGGPGVFLSGAVFGLAAAAIDARMRQVDVGRDAYRRGLWIMLIVWLFLSYRLISPGFLYPVLAMGGILFFCREAATARSASVPDKNEAG